MSTVIAFHGGYLSPAAMQRDMNDPSWVNEYLSSKSVDDAANAVSKHESVVLIGYSIGGSLIGHLSHLLDNIEAVVLYESPLINTGNPSGNFPVLWIRNRYKSTPRREKEFSDTLAEWHVQHPVTEITGKGRHIAWRWGCPPFAHAWDVSLNDWVWQWIQKQLSDNWDEL